MGMKRPRRNLNRLPLTVSCSIALNSRLSKSNFYVRSYLNSRPRRSLTSQMHRGDLCLISNIIIWLNWWIASCAVSQSSTDSTISRDLGRAMPSKDVQPISSTINPPLKATFKLINTRCHLIKNIWFRPSRWRGLSLAIFGHSYRRASITAQYVISGYSHLTTNIKLKQATHLFGEPLKSGLELSKDKLISMRLMKLDPNSSHWTRPINDVNAQLAQAT